MPYANIVSHGEKVESFLCQVVLIFNIYLMIMCQIYSGNVSLLFPIISSWKKAGMFTKHIWIPINQHVRFQSKLWLNGSEKGVGALLKLTIQCIYPILLLHVCPIYRYILSFIIAFDQYCLWYLRYFLAFKIPCSRLFFEIINTNER